MRFLGEDTPTPVLHGYLTSPLSTEIVQNVQFDFASTADEQVRLAIHDDPEFYGKSAEDVRRALEARDSEVDNFLLVEEDVAEVGAGWYVGGWVTEEEFRDGIVKSRDQPVVWRLRVMIKAAPARWVDYSIANSSIQEDIDLTIDTWPWDPSSNPVKAFGQEDFPQPVESETQAEPDHWRPPAYITAEPGEWESGPGNLMDIDPPQERVYRLKKEIAEQFGLRNEWAAGWTPADDATDPEGSMCFAQSYL